MNELEPQFNPGLIPDKVDARDFLVSDILGASQVDWEKGYSVFETLKIPVPVKDQNGSSSCTGQGSAQQYRVKNQATTSEDKDFSPKFIYSQIAFPQGGAQLRDAMKVMADMGVSLEATVPSLDNGKPPSEAFMTDLSWKTEQVLKEAKAFDKFNYRMIPGGTSDIDLFADAIQKFGGILMGFTGSNNGWCKPLISVPSKDDRTWGHAVYGCAYGMYEGKKCVFTPNSWGNRYGIKEGRWKGLQAIPEDYFLAETETAVGKVKGYLVFNSWVLVDDEQLPPNQKLMDFINYINQSLNKGISSKNLLTKITFISIR